MSVASETTTTSSLVSSNMSALISPTSSQGSARPMSQLAARLTQPTEQLRTLLQRPVSSDTMAGPLVSQPPGTPISTTKVWVPGMVLRVEIMRERIRVSGILNLVVFSMVCSAVELVCVQS